MAARGAVLSRETDADAQGEQDVSHQVTKAVEAPAELCLHELRARDLAITAIDNAVELENRRADDEAEIGALNEGEAGEDRQNENQQTPCAWSNRKFQKPAREPAGKRSVHVFRNETVLRFAIAAEQS